MGKIYVRWLLILIICFPTALFFHNKMIFFGSIGVGIGMGLWTLYSLFINFENKVIKVGMPIICGLIAFLIAFTKSVLFAVLWAIILLFFIIKKSKK